MISPFLVSPWVRLKLVTCGWAAFLSPKGFSFLLYASSLKTPTEHPPYTLWGHFYDAPQTIFQQKGFLKYKKSTKRGNLNTSWHFPRNFPTGRTSRSQGNCYRISPPKISLPFMWQTICCRSSKRNTWFCIWRKLNGVVCLPNRNLTSC